MKNLLTFYTNIMRLKNYLIVLVSTVIFSCSGQGIISLERTEGDLLTVECELNDKVKVPFILDTGCTTTTMPYHVFMTLVETNTLTREDFIEYRTYILADGSKGSSPVVLIRKLKIGDVVFEDVEVSIGMTQGASLLLGNNVLSQLCKVTLDYEQNTLEYEN